MTRGPSHADRTRRETGEADSHGLQPQGLEPIDRAHAPQQARQAAAQEYEPQRRGIAGQLERLPGEGHAEDPGASETV